MQLFKNTSIRRKQTLIMMLTSAMVLLLACAAFSVYDMLTFRQELGQRVTILADAIGNNCAAAIDFNDPKTAADTLAALRADNHIVAACVYARDGQAFATYKRDAAAAFAPPPVQSVGQKFTGDELHLFRAIRQQSEGVGTIFVAADLRGLSSRLMSYVQIVGVVFLTSLLAAVLLSSRLQRLVSDPILNLAQAARTVAHDKNYSIRATKQSNDELGQLVDGFNEMLAQIQSRDVDLQTARENLEHRVQERTHELAESISLLNATLESTADSIVAVDLTGKILSLNSKFTGLWQFPAAMLQRRDSVEMKLFTVEQVKEPEKFKRLILAADADLGAGLFDVVELKDGRIFERYVFPQRIDGKRMGTVVNYRDITERRRTETELAKMHSELLDISRQAGMAEIATNVLHNVGNVLNSVNVSAGLVADSVKKSKASSLAKVVVLLREHEQDLGAFFTSDPRGRQLSDYLSQLSEHFLADQTATVKELDSLRANIEHIKEIVAMQQSYARVSGVKEVINLQELVEDSLRMNDGALSRHRVEVVREFGPVPPMNVEKHKILQILVNLIRNAKYACDESGRADRRLTMRVADGDGRVRISVMDNGVGIPPENLTRIFSHGFTTRKDGHGFGLHSGALAAKEMGGSLTVHSAGHNQGATFTLELPGTPIEELHE